VVLADLDAAPWRAPARNPRRVPGAQLSEVIADVGSEDSAARIVAQRNAPTAASTFSSITGIRSTNARRAKRETWERILAVNLLSYAYLSREALPRCAPRRRLHRHVSSMHAFIRAPAWAVRRHEVRHRILTRTLALKKRNTACASMQSAPVPPSRPSREALRGGCRTQAEIDAIAASCCLLRRWARRARSLPILWLASEEASYVPARP